MEKVVIAGDLVSRAALIKKMFPYGMPDGGNYPINARAAMEALTGAAAVEAEAVVHARWEDAYGGKYANPRYLCSACKARALYEFEKNSLGQWFEVQALTTRCYCCGAHMDEEVENDPENR